jgi:hypothetical protein
LDRDIQTTGVITMFIEVDPAEDETLKIAERILSDSEAGKKTIEEIKKEQEKVCQKKLKSQN